MAIFVLVPRDENHRESLANAVREHFPADHYELPAGEFLISVTGTPMEIAKRLEIGTGSESLTGIVFSTAGYWGRAPTTIWDWIKAKLESSNG